MAQPDFQRAMTEAVTKAFDLECRLLEGLVRDHFIITKELVYRPTPGSGLTIELRAWNGDVVAWLERHIDTESCKVEWTTASVCRG